MRGNVNSSLRRRPSSMAEFDRLPPELRAWLAQAALPWSVPSVRKLWSRARRRHSPQAALAYLSSLEARALTRDAQQIWNGAPPPEAP
ncbi:MAG: DUF6525 family protein [Roseinatronobacter sp.]